MPRLAVVAVFAQVSLLAGCAYLGSARGFDPAEFDRDAGWIAVRGVEPILQETDSDCGAAALAMVLRHWDLPTTRRDVFEACGAPAGGIRAADLREYARKQGLKAFIIDGKLDDFEKELSRRRPVVVGTVKPYAAFVLTHYEVVVGLHPEKKLVVTLDPAEGWRQNTCDGFMEEWRLARCVTLVVFKGEGSAPPAQPE